MIHIELGSNTPLQKAVQAGDLQQVAHLLGKGAKVHIHDETGATPLHIAASLGHLKIVNELLAAGALAAVADHQGFTPLHVAAANGNIEIAANLLLLGRDIDQEVVDTAGRTPLHIAVINDHPDMVDFFAAKGVQINARDALGRAPLHHAVNQDLLEVADVLVANNADINIGDNFSRTPLHLAALQGREEHAALLLEKGANPNARDRFGRTPLHEAVLKNSGRIAALLLQHGADQELRDLLGRTPYNTAIAQHNQEMAEILIRYRQAAPPATAPAPGPERQEAELVDEKVQLYEEVLSSLPDHIYLFDRNGRFSYVNYSAAHALGRTPDSLIGKTWYELGFPRETTLVIIGRCETVFMCGRPVTGEAALPTRDGERYFEFILTPLHHHRGYISAILCTARDITERKQTEELARRAKDTLDARISERTEELHVANERLQQYNECLRLLLETTAGGMLISENGIIHEANARLGKMSGYRPEILVGMRLMDLVAQEDREPLQLYLAEGGTAPFSFSLVRKDGCRQRAAASGRALDGRNCETVILMVREDENSQG